MHTGVKPLVVVVVQEGTRQVAYMKAVVQVCGVGLRQ